MFIGQFQHVLFDLQVYKNLNSISHTTLEFSLNIWHYPYS